VVILLVRLGLQVGQSSGVESVAVILLKHLVLVVSRAVNEDWYQVGMDRWAQLNCLRGILNSKAVE